MNDILGLAADDLDPPPCPHGRLVCPARGADGTNVYMRQGDEGLFLTYVGPDGPRSTTCYVGVREEWLT